MLDIKIPDNSIKATISGKKNKTGDLEKVKIDRILIREEEMLQVSAYKGKQVFHKNLTDSDINQEIINYLTNDFNNASIFTKEYQYNYRITSKGKVLTNKQKILIP